LAARGPKSGTETSHVGEISGSVITAAIVEIAIVQMPTKNIETLVSPEEDRLVDPVHGDDHVAGPLDAPLSIVEYGDYQCSYCGQAYPIVRELQRTFQGKLRFVFRNLPLTNLHPFAFAAAEAAEAVALQGLFWPMHDLLFENQGDLREEALVRYAAQAGADTVKFAHAVHGGVPRTRVERDLASAIRSRVNGTPTFFVNDQRYDGAWDYQGFEGFLEATLEQRGR
jgi:protein-disulfide isomerase